MHQQNTLEQFIHITHLSRQQSLKYLNYGNYDLQLSLSYYYYSQQKTASKKDTSEGSQGKQTLLKLRQGAKKQAMKDRIIEDLKRDYSIPIEQVKVQEDKQCISKLRNVDYLAFAFDESKKKQIRWTQKKQGMIKEQFKQNKPTLIHRQQLRRNQISQATIRQNFYFLSQNIIQIQSRSKNNLAFLKNQEPITLKMQETKSTFNKKSKKYSGVFALNGYKNQLQISRFKQTQTRHLFPLLRKGLIKIELFMQGSQKKWISLQKFTIRQE